jgi:hypothetical protein
LFQRDSPALCHQIQTREKLMTIDEGAETKRDKSKRQEQEAVASIVSMISHKHAHNTVNAPKSPVLVRHKKVKKTTSDLFQARDQHDARLNMPIVHEATNTKRQHLLTQMKERQASFALAKQQRGAPVPSASMGRPGAAQAMLEFRHAQDAMVQARNRLMAHQSCALHQQEQLQVARRSPLLDGEVRHHQYLGLDPFAPLEHTIAMQRHALYYHNSAAVGRTQQLYTADGAQQGPSAIPAYVGGAGSCTPSVVHSQGYSLK